MNSESLPNPIKGFKGQEIFTRVEGKYESLIVKSDLTRRKERMLSQEGMV
jgi:hypothetical protein